MDGHRADVLGRVLDGSLVLLTFLVTWRFAPFIRRNFISCALTWLLVAPCARLYFRPHPPMLEPEKSQWWTSSRFRHASWIQEPLEDPGNQ